MDADATLADIRAEVASIYEDQDTEHYGLADKVRALDEWLTAGGFLPRAWTRSIVP